MPDTSASLRRFFAEFRRRRVVRVAIAYLIVGWVLVQVADATFEPLGLPPWATRLVIVLLALGFVLACVLSWIYDIQPHGIERTPALPEASSVEAPAPSPARRASDVAPPAPPAPPDASVAILPFSDLSEAHDQDYFCDGLAEEILNALAKVRGLHVASRTSSFRFRGRDAELSEIGRQLGVAAIMEGSVRKAGDRVRVTAQLVSASNGYHLWSENFDRNLEDIFAIQEEIARNVVNAVRPTLQSPIKFDLEKRAPRDMRAYEFYLRGRQLEGRTTELSWKQAPLMFRRAIEIDPEYAQAWAGLADSLCELLMWRLEVAHSGALEEAKNAAHRALELDPNLAEAHVAKAHALSMSGDHDAATEAYERALSLDPGLYVANYYYGRECFTQGRYLRAVDLFEAAHRAQPDEFQAITLAVNAADAAGDEERKKRLAIEGLACASHQAEIDPENARAHYLTAGLMQHLGVGDKGRAEMEFALRIRPDDFDVLYNGACYYALGNDPDRSLDLLERAVERGEGFLDWIEHDSDFRHVQHLPRFKALVATLKPRQDA
ncbi:tetratricopeptide repeat protein [Lysobacter sp. KIS68-7]|uniref:TPR end-of-group domain-containing protein n=1 Tax=Lysobacter sp. KIS68-7 TaxID=2904252 RepID=UPI001E2C7398|nr:tetratricopeptide repeat protein [Lysobacter sp. KIS68-7]UHQ18251.1 tetratricopeptide repeat protein [Lysobacter sp. KIS68-7]